MKKFIIIYIIILSGFTLKAQESKIAGNWKLTQVEANGEIETDIKLVFIFTEKGVFKLAKDANSRTMDAGTWKYDKKQHAIVLVSEIDKDFRGEAEIIKLTDTELVFKKEGAISTFNKLAKMNPPAKVEMEKPILSFESEDFYQSENGFDEKTEARKLPWKIEAVVNYLKNKKEVVFQNTSFPDSREAATWVVSTKFNYNETDQTLDARNYSYAQNDYIDMTEQPISVDYFKENKEDFRFYPEEELDYYKVVSTNEILKTALGEFECTVVEGMGGFSEKFQYWMVNNQPGVFAKIITVKDQEPPFGRTTVQITKEAPIQNSEFYNQKAKIEHLPFEEEDFFTEDLENYKYSNEKDKLPWQDFHLLLGQLSDIKQLVYSCRQLIEETNTFETKILKADVYVKVENQRLKIDNIFNGYDRYNAAEGDVYLGDYENGNADLYPLDERMFRVIGQEDLTLNLGTVNCTVIEALNDNEKLKIRLMNDKPAIIAKVIKEPREDSNSHYSIYELQEIITTN